MATQQTSFLADVGALEAAGIAIMEDVAAFAAGSPVHVPPIPLPIPANAQGAAELHITLQKGIVAPGFSFGSLAAALGGVVLAELTGAPIVLPAFVERVGNTSVAVSASFVRVPPASTGVPPASTAAGALAG